MIDQESTFILGAQDPEMREIAKVLRSESRPLMNAANAGVPVSARTAYGADSVVRISRSGYAGAYLA